MFNKDEKSLKGLGDVKPNPPQSATPQPTPPKKKFVKSYPTREVDRDFALRIIREHMSSQGAGKA